MSNECRKGKESQCMQPYLQHDNLFLSLCSFAINKRRKRSLQLLQARFVNQSNEGTRKAYIYGCRWLEYILALMQAEWAILQVEPDDMEKLKRYPSFFLALGIDLEFVLWIPLLYSEEWWMYPPRPPWWSPWEFRWGLFTGASRAPQDNHLDRKLPCFMWSGRVANGTVRPWLPLPPWRMASWPSEPGGSFADDDEDNDTDWLVSWRPWKLIRELSKPWTAVFGLVIAFFIFNFSRICVSEWVKTRMESLWILVNNKHSQYIYVAQYWYIYRIRVYYIRTCPSEMPIQAINASRR